MWRETQAPQTGPEKFGRKSARELFLDRMEQVMPWGELLALVEPQDLPAAGDQPPVEPSILLRTYFVQRWFNLSDSGAEDALYESPVLRRFVGVDLGVAPAPVEASIRGFHHLLEEHGLDSQILSTVDRHLVAHGIRIETGANGDAKIADASYSTENGAGEHAPQTNPAGKEDQRYIAADAHRLPLPAHADGNQAYQLNDEDLFIPPTAQGGAAYQGQPEAQDRNGRYGRPNGNHHPVRAGGLSIAVISPDKRRRNDAIRALEECQNGPIREFTSYPPNLSDVPRTLNREFDVVIVDLDTDLEYALDLVKSICTDGLATVMVYSAKTDPELLLRSMRAGAREFLTMPFAPGAMAEALGRASTLRSALHPARKTEGKLLVFLSAKGGSGVTTLACSFAVSLAQDSGQRILLIDLNLPLGDVAINLGIRADHSVVNALDDFKRLDSSFLSSMLVEHGSGLFVLAAPTELAPSKVSDEAVDRLLQIARQEFDYVVVDAGSKLDLQSTHLFHESSAIYLVTQVGIAELRNSNRLIARLSASGNPKVSIVLNRYDPRNVEITDELVTKALTRPAEWKIPNNYAAVRRMQNTATSLMQDDSELSRAIRQMTRAITGQPAVPEKKKGFSFFR
jgi:pilus assembly protein CpaE